MELFQYLIFSVEQANKNYFGTQKTMEDRLQVLFETVTMNLAYPVDPQNLHLLLDQNFYFDICSLTFPQFKIKITKIVQNQALTPQQKIQKLFQLLTEQLQINFVALSARQILKGHLLHTYQFLNVIKQFTQLPPFSANNFKLRLHQRFKSQPVLFQQQNLEKYTQSARQKHKEISELNSAPQQNPNIKNPKENVGQQFRSSEQQNMMDSEIQGNQNIPIYVDQNKQQQVAQTQKTRSKNKTKSHKLFKKDSPRLFEKKLNKKYKKQLQNLIKRQKMKRKKTMQQTQRPLSSKIASWKKESKDIDSLFKSFQFKIRDEKIKSLGKIEQLIRTKENQRMRIQQKLELQRAKEVYKRQKQMASNLQSVHLGKNSLLKKQQRQKQYNNSLIKKQMEKKIRQTKRQLRQSKIKQISHIKNHITQLNSKLLMKLEEGGELQRALLKIYKIN